MQYDIVCEATVEGEIDSLWNVWTDPCRYPTWDPREEETRLDGPFAPGTTGWSKQVGRRPGAPFLITRVEQPDRFVSECPLPGGKLEVDHLLIRREDGTVTLRKIYRVYGPLAIAFRLHYAREIRRNVPGTFAALAAEAERRKPAATR